MRAGIVVAVLSVVMLGAVLGVSADRYWRTHGSHFSHICYRPFAAPLHNTDRPLCPQVYENHPQLAKQRVDIAPQLHHHGS
jgi:hypothetical protein